MATERRCGKCKGSGVYRYASGAEGHCSLCSGKGGYTPATAEEKAARASWDRAYTAMAHMPRTFTAEGVGPARFRRGVLAGLEVLGENEPHRLPALFAAVDAGRLADVAVALYRYSQEG